LEVETDKAQVEIPSPMSGRVETIHVRPGQTVKVGQVLVSFGDGGTPPGRQSAATEDATRRLAPETTTVVDDGRARQRPTSPGARVSEGPVPATPATRRLARELGVDLRNIVGTGRGGRVSDEDVRAAASRSAGPSDVPRVAEPARTAQPERGPAKPLATVGLQPPALPSFEQWGPIERQALSHLRRTIAERMTLS